MNLPKIRLTVLIKTAIVNKSTYTCDSDESELGLGTWY